MMDMIKINGIWIPTPGSFSWGMSDLDASAERSASGFLIRERIRSGVRKVTFSWSAFPDMQKFYNFIKAMEELPEEFEMQYPDATGELLTKTMYRTDVNAEMQAYKDGRSHWKDCKTSFVEI